MAGNRVTDNLNLDLMAAADNPANANAIADATDGRDEPPRTPPPPADPKKAGDFRRRFFNAASVQDKILDKILSQMIPVDGLRAGQVHDTDIDGDTPLFAERPAFAVATMSNNFRRFNARIGVVFKFQARVIRFLSWRRPAQTLSFLAIYSFVCLNPYLLCVLPLVLVLFGILVPSFVARHPAPPDSGLSPQAARRRRSSNSAGASATEHRVRQLGYSLRGPPLAPAPMVRPVKELSRDFFRNMRDLQNSMEDYSVAHDQVVALVVPATNFSDEARSSAIVILLFAAAALMSIAAHLLPWRFLALATGWAAVVSMHPVMARPLHRAQRHFASGGTNPETGKPGGVDGGVNNVLVGAFNAWVASDIILDEAPETREVEIFELQRRTAATGGEWEAWLFSPSPYDPLSAARIAGDRPRGTRFFEDVLPPAGGWEWSEKKWVLDLWSREWVEERIITGVEVETEGERWVYDMFNENEMHAGVVEPPGAYGGGGHETESGKGSSGGCGTPVGSSAGICSVRNGAPISWEESEEGLERRGEWRRRRWVRMVKRKNLNFSHTA